MKKLFAIALALTMLLSLAACGEGEPTTAPTTNPSNGGTALTNVGDIYEAMIAGLDMPEMMALDSDLMLDLCGIPAENYRQGVVYICADSLRADEIWVLEAVSGDAMTALKQQAQARLSQKDAESLTYSPEQNAVVKAAQVIQFGDYLAVIVSPNADTIAQQFRTAIAP